MYSSNVAVHLNNIVKDRGGYRILERVEGPGNY